MNKALKSTANPFFQFSAAKLTKIKSKVVGDALFSLQQNFPSGISRHQAVITDRRKEACDANNRYVLYYDAALQKTADYYVFGMEMAERNLSVLGRGYRYGFNGKEISNEIAPGLTTALYWEYDSRTGRRWNMDPVLNDGISPYNTFKGNPILYSDRDGNVPILPIIYGLAIAFGGGAAVDWGFQVGFNAMDRNKNPTFKHALYTNVNYWSVGISGLTSVATGGTSLLLKPMELGLKKKAASFVSTVAIDMVESTAKQYTAPRELDENSKEKAFKLSYGQIASDVVANQVGGLVNKFEGLVSEGSLNEMRERLPMLDFRAAFRRASKADKNAPQELRDKILKGELLNIGSNEVVGETVNNSFQEYSNRILRAEQKPKASKVLLDPIELPNVSPVDNVRTNLPIPH